MPGLSSSSCLSREAACRQAKQEVPLYYFAAGVLWLVERAEDNQSVSTSPRLFLLLLMTALFALANRDRTTIVDPSITHAAFLPTNSVRDIQNLMTL